MQGSYTEVFMESEMKGIRIWRTKQKKNIKRYALTPFFSYF